MLILASASPRRIELLRLITDEFIVIPSTFDETNNGLEGKDYALYCALNKAKEVHSRAAKMGDVVLAADTIIVNNNNSILVKPKDRHDAIAMLKGLSSNTHRVITAVAIISSKGIISDYDTSLVTFDELPEEDIIRYVEAGSPLDKAGAYGLQDDFISARTRSVVGSKTNIIGLPIGLVKKMLQM